MWYLINAKEKVLGRLATKIVPLLCGKHRVSYAPNLDSGDHVIVINAEKVTLSGNKEKTKEYFSHSGFPGGAKSIGFQKLIIGNPEKVLLKAVKGMLPKNRLGRRMLRRLRVYHGENHPHFAQKPVVIDG